MSSGLKKSAINQDSDRGILNPAQSACSFRVERFKPSSRLDSFVDHYWIVRWDLPKGKSYLAEVLPRPNVNLTFMPEGPRITGVTTGKYDYKISGKGAVFGVMFKPASFHSFFNDSLSLLTDKTLPASKVFSRADRGFNDRLLLVQDSNEMVRIVEETIFVKLPCFEKQVFLVNDVVEAIGSLRGRGNVEELSKRFGKSTRTLQHLFNKYVGVGPKWVIMRDRLIEAAEQVSHGGIGWAELAAQLGYSDQAHFSNDFKKMVGQTPAEYRASTKGN